MKKLQQLCLAGVFTLLLTTATFAGEIGTGGKTPHHRLRHRRLQQPLAKSRYLRKMMQTNRY